MRYREREISLEYVSFWEALVCKVCTLVVRENLSFQRLLDPPQKKNTIHSCVHFREYFRERVGGSNFAVRMLCAVLIHRDSGGWVEVSRQISLCSLFFLFPTQGPIPQAIKFMKSSSKVGIY